MEEENEKTVLEVFCEVNDIALPETIEDDIICLDINGVADIWLLYLGDGMTEVFAELKGLDADDPGIMRLLLEANYLGLATDEARLAINPMDGNIVISERWGHQRLLAEDASKDLERFAKLAHAWRSEGVAQIRAKMRGEDVLDEFEDEMPDESVMMRI